MDDGVTFALTSCGRLDLLRRTIGSFRAANPHPLARWVLVDDSGDPAVHAALRRDYGRAFTLLLDERRAGQAACIDRLYAAVETEWIFHCEDDWEFFNPGRTDFVAQSMELLQADPRAGQVWVREPGDSWHRPEDEVRVTASGVPWSRVPPDGGWNGFSWNPGLRRRSHYRAAGPFAALGDEWCAMRRYGELFAWRAVQLRPGFCRHIGWERHVE